MSAPAQNEPDLWHHHNDRFHQHSRGNVPHDHKWGVAVYKEPDDEKTENTDTTHPHYERKSATFRDFWPLFLVGSIISGGMWAFTQQGMDECSNGLISAFVSTTCEKYSIVHTLGIGGFWIFLVLMGASLFMRIR